MKNNKRNSGFATIPLIIGIALVIGVGAYFVGNISSKLGGISTTELTDTINTFRTNVNSSLTYLNTAVFSVGGVATTTIGLTAGMDMTISTSTSAITIGNTYASSTWLKTANNLSDLTVTSTARTNLGLTDTAVTASSTWLKVANDGSDINSTSTFRSNLDAMEFVAPGTSGNVLTSDGTNWVSGVGTGGTATTTIFTSSETWTKPSGLKFIIVEVQAGGGGGGKTDGSALQASGGGGGGYSRKQIKAASLSATTTVTVGAGGALENNGGNSSFGTFATSTGGTKGVSATDNSNGGAGGGASNGDLNIPGGMGGVCSAGSSGFKGSGGDSFLGNGGAGTYGTAGGVNGVGYGSGGSGGWTTGAGASGIVIITEFY